MSEDKYRTTSFRYTPVNQLENIANKQHLIDIQQSMVTAPLDELDDAIHAGYQMDANVNVAHPINELSGHVQISETFWKPLRQALPDMERRDNIVAGGIYREQNWIGCIGHFVGTFAHDWLGIPATQGIVHIRYGEGHHIQDGKIVTSYHFIDLLDLMNQVGYYPIAPSLGREMFWLPPVTHDGVILTPQGELTSQGTIEKVLQMHAALGKFDGTPPSRAVLDKMEMYKHWHPNFMWYGPAGIGTTRGLSGFEDYHQIPFLVAFPDRSGSDIGHFIRVGDGHYAVTGGWGYLQGTHTGDDFLGLPATNKHVKMRVMDFYRCDDETIVENWVPFDIPHLLLQLGVDIFGRMRHQFRQHKRSTTSQWLVS